jgi:soluble lytic murein transglycosylase-like protein
LAGVLLMACAGVARSIPSAARPLPVQGETLHDPAAEWAATNEQPPVRSTTRLRRIPQVEWVEEEAELPEFSADDQDRIAFVQPYVRDAARAHEVPPDLVNGIIWVESRFQVRALGRKGPRGLMQLMPATAREVGDAIGKRCEPYDPEFNIHAGTYYFARMVERFQGNLRLALAAYNIGPGVVGTWLQNGAPLPGHSRVYIDNVLAAARAFRARERSPIGPAREQQVEKPFVATVGRDPGQRGEERARGL